MRYAFFPLRKQLIKTGQKKEFLNGSELETVTEGQLPARHSPGEFAFDIVMQIIQKLHDRFTVF